MSFIKPRSPLTALYEEHVHDSELRRNLNTVVLAAAIGMFFFSTTTGSAMTGLANYFGAGDFVFGILWAMPVFAGLFQFAASSLLEKTRMGKKIFLIAGVIQRGIWLIVAFLTLIFPETVAELRIWGLVLVVLLSSVAAAYMNIGYYSFFSALVPIDIRGRFISIRSILCLMVSATGGIVAAWLLDSLPGYSGFAVVFTLASLCGLADILLFAPAKLPQHVPAKTHSSFISGLRAVMSDKTAKNCFLFWMAYNFGLCLSSSFFNRFALEVQQLSFLQITIFGQIAYSVPTLIFLPRWGRFLDRYGSRPLLMITGTFTALFVLVWMPARPSSVIPILTFNLMGSMIWCGTDITAHSMLLSHSNEENRSMFIAVFSVMASFGTALGSLSGGALLQWTRPYFTANPVWLFGSLFDHYKFLFLVSVVVRMLATWIFVPRLWNERGMSTAEVAADIRKRLRRRIGAIVNGRGTR